MCFPILKILPNGRRGELFTGRGPEPRQSQASTEQTSGRKREADEDTTACEIDSSRRSCEELTSLDQSPGFGYGLAHPDGPRVCATSLLFGPS